MEPEEEEDKDLRLQVFLQEENSPCVCARSWGEILFCGWTQRKERKERKRVELSRAERTQPLPRKDREKPSNQASLCDGFVFRHYEDPRRYIEQYRENHSLSRVDSDVELRPVLGVGVPDPYFPKICSSSVLLERIKIIEAISDYYKSAVFKSDVENIRLTGVRAETADRKMSRPSLPARPNTFEYLPTINQSANTNRDTHTIAAVAKKHSKTKRKKEDKNKTNEDQPSSAAQSLEIRFSEEQPGSKIELDLQPTKLRNETATKEQKSSELKSCLPNCRWTEVENAETVASSRKVVNFRTKKKVKTFEQSSSESGDENTARIPDGAVPPGSVYTGSTVKPQSVKMAGVSGVSLGKCELFSSSLNTKQNSSTSTTHTKRSPMCYSQEAFIGVFGQATGPQPKAKVKIQDDNGKENDKKVESPRVPQPQFSLPYVSHVGKRHQFHYVLHARSYKPNGKLNSAAVANLYWK